IGESFSTLFTSEDRQQGLPEQELRNAGNRGSASHFHWQLRKDRPRFSLTGFLNPLGDEAGNLIGGVRECSETTAKELADDARRESEADFRAIFELAGTGKAQADLRTGRLLRINQKLCDITGYSVDELLAMTIQELTRPEDREQDFAVY